MKDMMALLPDIKLRFNIEHPSLEDCYLHGYECAQAERSEAENPFQLDSQESDQWLEGWWAGFYGDAPLYEASEEIAEHPHEAANDHIYGESVIGFLTKVLEITSLIAISAVVGYQVIDLVA